MYKQFCLADCLIFRTVFPIDGYTTSNIWKSSQIARTFNSITQKLENWEKNESTCVKILTWRQGLGE